MEPEDFVKAVLESMGYSCNKIPESKKRTPDFFISSEEDPNTYLLELKTRYDNDVRVKSRNERLAAGEIVLECDPAGMTNSISRRVRTAKKQIKDYIEKSPTFRLVWFLSRGSDLLLQSLQTEVTLYGSTKLWEVRNNSFNKPPSVKQCYYFRNSVFWRHRKWLDGAIVSSDKKGKFCVNDRSINYNQLIRSELVNKFGNGVIDPKAEELQGDAFIADCSSDRNDEKETLQYVQAKYSTDRLVIFDLERISATSNMQLTPD